MLPNARLIGSLPRLLVTENLLNGKIRSDSTFYRSMNYWVPLAYNDDINDDDINNTTKSGEQKLMPTHNDTVQALTAIQPTFKTVFEQWLRQCCGL